MAGGQVQAKLVTSPKQRGFTARAKFRNGNGYIDPRLDAALLKPHPNDLVFCTTHQAGRLPRGFQDLEQVRLGRALIGSGRKCTPVEDIKLKALHNTYPEVEERLDGKLLVATINTDLFYEDENHSTYSLSDSPFILDELSFITPQGTTSLSERIKLDKNATLLDRIESLDPRENTAYLVCALIALSWFHRTKMAHGDFKPENVFMRILDDEHLAIPCLADSSLARRSTEKYGDKSLAFLCSDWYSPVRYAPLAKTMLTRHFNTCTRRASKVLMAMYQSGGVRMLRSALRRATENNDTNDLRTIMGRVSVSLRPGENITEVLEDVKEFIRLRDINRGKKNFNMKEQDIFAAGISALEILSDDDNMLNHIDCDPDHFFNNDLPDVEAIVPSAPKYLRRAIEDTLNLKPRSLRPLIRALARAHKKDIEELLYDDPSTGKKGFREAERELIRNELRTLGIEIERSSPRHIW